VLKVGSMDWLMPFLVAYHCTIFIVNLLFLLCTLLLSLPRPTSAANPPAAAAAVDRRDRQTDGWTLNRFLTLTAYYADGVTRQWCIVGSAAGGRHPLIIIIIILYVFV